MASKIKDFVNEQREILAERASRLRTEPVKAARAATAKSAERIKALNPRIRAVSRSGVKLTAISQGAAERLIQLQEQLVTSALTDAATQLERTRERIVSDITEAVTILKGAGGDVRKVATHTYESVTGKATPAAAKAKAARRKVKRAVRKAPARKK